MISVVQGIIYDKEGQLVTVLTNGGVGYVVTLSLLHANAVHVGDQISLPVYLRVTDSALDLYGFKNNQERSFFSLLLSVSGVGPKSAMNILGLGSIEEIQSAISRKDVAYLTAVQGMGKKTAERLVVELKSKIKTSSTEQQDEKLGSVLQDVIEGLVAMGYSKEDARDAATTVADADTKSVEEVLREALRGLAK